jgi:hypothetical protein
MPVAETPKDQGPIKPNVRISDSQYVSQVVDTRKTDINTLSSYLSGQKWQVDYYRQILGRDSAGASYQDGLPPAYGQYELIRNFQLVVTDDLKTVQDTQDTNNYRTTGAGLIYNCLPVQDGDMFIADIGNGMNGIFQVNESTIGGYYPEAATAVTWTLTRQVTRDFLDRLNNNRVETESYFSLENFRSGLKPILTLDDMNVIKRLANARSRLLHLYFKDFFDDARETFVVPVVPSLGGLLTYDPYVVRFMKSILETRDHVQVSAITAHGVSADLYSNQVSLFDALAQRDPGLLYSASRKMGLSPIRAFRQRPLFAGIAFSGIKQVVTAIDAAFNVNTGYHAPHAAGKLAKADVRQDDMRSLLPQLDLTGEEPRGGAAAWIKRVVVDDYYVLSEAFYEGNTAQMSRLEFMINERLNNRPIDLKELADLADYAHKYDNLERFYYTPLILTLIKLAPGVL